MIKYILVGFNSELEKTAKTKAITNDKMDELIYDFINKHPNPDDDQIHELAEKHGINPHEMENHIYRFLTAIVRGGKSAGKKVRVSPHQMRVGMQVEKEHSPLKPIRRKTVKDHIVERGDYYTPLKKFVEKKEG